MNPYKERTLILILLIVMTLHLSMENPEQPTMFITKSPRGRSIISGTSYYIQCITKLGKNSTTSWLNPQGQRMSNRDNRTKIEMHILNNTDNRNTLLATELIFNPTQMKDSGNYTCLLESNTQKITKHFFLVVLPNLHEFKTDLIYKTRLNTNLTLSCYELLNHKLQHIIWKRNNSRIEQNIKYKLNRDNSITIMNITMEDQGDYQCQLLYTNVKNSTLVENFNLKVNIAYSPKWTSSMSKSYNQLASPNKKLSLSCESIAYPPPTLIWSKNNKNIESTLLTVKPNTVKATLTLNTTEETFGTYICTALNEEGRISHPVSLINIYSPPPPPDIRITKIGTKSIEFKTIPMVNNLIPIQKIVIVYMDPQKNKNITHYYLTNATENSIINLLPETTYTLNFRSLSNVGIPSVKVNTLRINTNSPREQPSINATEELGSTNSTLFSVILCILVLYFLLP